MTWKRILAIGLAIFALAATMADAWRDKPEFVLTLNHPDGIYKSGEEIVFSAQLLKHDKPMIGQKVFYEFYVDPDLSEKGDFVVGEAPFVFRTKCGTPGWRWMKFYTLDEKGKPVTLFWPRRGIYVDWLIIGAITDPDKIEAPVPAPTDFDEFWAARRKLLKESPWKARKVEVPMPAEYRQYADKLKLYDVTVDCPGRAPVRAALTVPVDAQKGKMPMIVNFHSYGVFSAKPMPDYALDGALVLDVNSNGIDNFKPQSYYTELSQGRLRGRVSEGLAAPETYYNCDMLLRALRAMDYARSLPEWDGKRLIVIGGSLGGAQGIPVIAMTPEVSLAMISVPAYVDMLGATARYPRTSGWPKSNRKLKPDGTLPNPVAAKTLAYYDGVNFAKDIHCEIYVQAGLADQSVCPVGVWAFYNALASRNKHMTMHPDLGHAEYNYPNAEGVRRIREYIRAAPEK